MELVSLEFVLFFIGAVFVYYVLNPRLRWMWLLFCSLAFFTLVGGYKTLPFLLSSVIITYSGSIAIYKISTVKKKQAVLFTTVLLMLIQLVLIKGGTIFFSPEYIQKRLALAIPIGISYFTLTLIGYVIDVFRDVVIPQKNIFKHALFACYFPTLISGPIIRYNDIKQQLFNGNKFSVNSISFGLQRMLFGFFKKMVIADRLFVVVQAVYSNSDAYGGFYIVVATLCYAVVLYADFSGCIDIIMGVSETLGIRLPENFDAPFCSKTISEFWRRWHITLGLWFKDYVLYPLLKTDVLKGIGNIAKRKLGKKHGKNVPTYIGLAVIWFSLGIWHGGNPKWMMASAMLPFIYIVSSELLHTFLNDIVKLLKINTHCASFRIFQRIRTLLLMCVCWVFVCSPNLVDGLRNIRSTFTAFSPLTLISDKLFNLGLNTQEIVVVFVNIGIVTFVEYIKHKGIGARTILSKQNVFFKYCALWYIALAIMIFGKVDGSRFIYFQF